MNYPASFQPKVLTQEEKQKRAQQKIKEVNDIENRINNLKRHKNENCHDFKVNIILLKLIHRKSKIKKYILKKYKIKL